MAFKLNVDKISSTVYKSLDIMFMMKPERTSYGSVLGAVLVGSKKAICSIASEKISVFISNLEWYAIFLLGLLLVRFDVIIYKEPLDKNILAKLNSLRKVINESNLTEQEKRQMYRKLITTSIENENKSKKINSKDVTE